jgi:hypothetical protein
VPDSFTVFNASNREPNVVHSSATYQIPVDSTDTRVRFTLNTLDPVAEPNTTILYWEIQRNDGSGWAHMTSGSIHGQGGVEPPKPIGNMTVEIDGIRGQQLRGTVYFESANNQRKRFGVSAETF